MTDEISRNIAALVLTVRICFKHLPKKGITWGFLSPEQTHSIIFLARRGETVVFLFGFIWFATVADALMGRVRTDVPQSLSSKVPLFTSPYVSQSRCSPTLYSPVPMFPSPFLPRRGTPYVSKSLCFPVHLLPSPYVPQRCSPIPMFPNSFVPQSRCSPKVFLVPMFPKDVPQPLCSPIPLFPSPDVPLKCFQSLCSPKIFLSPHAPQSL